MTSDELDRIRARHADCEPERCEDVHRLLAVADRHMCQCGHWMAEHGPCDRNCGSDHRPCLVKEPVPDKWDGRTLCACDDFEPKSET